MMRYLSGGESHGKEMAAIIEGFPANVAIDNEKIEAVLARRRNAPGRGGRMLLERDQFQVLAGLRGGLTLGSPIVLTVPNIEWEKWIDDMNPWSAAKQKKHTTVPRPGHADLAGAFKYRQADLRNISERASARETVVRTLVGCFAMQLLEHLGINIHSQALKTGSGPNAIALAQAAGDTVGGVVGISIKGLPGGVGSHVHWDRRLDARLAGALMSIQGVKGIDFGHAFDNTELTGSQYHDEFTCQQGYYQRKTNHAGGLEGGMSNGEEVVIRAVIKPIPTLSSPLLSFDCTTKEQLPAPVVRHDTSAVGAAAVVAEAVCAWEIAVCIIQQFGGDTMEDLTDSFNRYRARWEETIRCLGR